MPQATSVITPTRFSQGLTYADFVSQATVNRDKFEQYYQDPALTAGDLAFFQRAAALPHGPRKMLAIAEAWCGDVYRELPTLARIAEHAGMDLRVFLRDENPDVMDEFLSNDGKARAIPVFVFYTGDMQYIAHFTERSANAHAELASISSQVKTELNLPQTATFANLPDAERQVFLRAVIARIQPRFEQWRKESIQEMRELLAKALNLPRLD